MPGPRRSLGSTSICAPSVPGSLSENPQFRALPLGGFALPMASFTSA